MPDPKQRLILNMPMVLSIIIILMIKLLSFETGSANDNHLTLNKHLLFSELE